MFILMTFYRSELVAFLFSGDKIIGKSYFKKERLTLIQGFRGQSIMEEKLWQESEKSFYSASTDRSRGRHMPNLRSFYYLLQS